MPITDSYARELAVLLPEGLAYTDSRSRLICLVEILHALTDESHRLTNADIRKVFAARFGEDACPAENTVNSDLRILRENGVLGLAVHTTPAGSWCENAQLPPGRVRLLLNAVQASRFLTTEQSYQLQEDLINLVSRHQEDGLLGEVFVDQRTRRGYEQVFETNDLITAAIRQGRKIEFEYTYSGFDGKPHTLTGDDGQVVRIETPIGLVFSENNYYLESYSAVPWRHGINIMHSRVDRMYNVRISQDSADEDDAVEEARRTLRSRMSQTIDMVDGPQRTIFLRVRADCTNVMFDEFGFGLKFGHFSGKIGEAQTTAITCVEVAESFTFFRWLSSAGDGIVIVRPDNELELRSGPWPKHVKAMPLERLTADYEAVLSGYLAYLDRARSPYVQ